MKRNKKKRYIRMVLLLIMMICLMQLGQAYFALSHHKTQQNYK